MSANLAREYLDIIDKIRYGQFRDKKHLHWLEGQRAVLHNQLERATGKSVTVAMARRMAARSR